MVSQTEHIDAPPWLEDHFIGGHPALDFVNTQSHRIDVSASIDRFNSIQKISSWLVYLKLANSQQTKAVINQHAHQDDEKRLVQSLNELRQHAGKIFDAIADNQQIPAHTHSRILSMASQSDIQIDSINHDNFQASRFSLNSTDTNAVSALIALLVVDAVFRLPASRIHRCPGCGWVFFDQSKGGRRKWCDMRACGNRAKVAKHYRLHKQA